jgi:HEAT repeat protein
VPDALCVISPTSAVQAIIASIHTGYSTAAAVETMLHHASTLEEVEMDPVVEALLALVSRWNPGTREPTGDTCEAVIAALRPLTSAALSNARLLPPLCALLGRRPDHDVTAAVLHLFAARVWLDDRDAAPVIAALSEHIAHPDKEIRVEAANVLLRFNDSLGRELNQWLDACWPQGSLLSRLHAILTGSPEAGQVANQAIQQMSQWFNKLSREGADRLWAAGAASATASSGYDVRLPDTVRQLLHNALTALESATAAGEIENLLALCTAAIRVLERFGIPTLLCAYDELWRALSLVTSDAPRAALRAGLPGGIDRRDYGQMVRSAAASLFLNGYGADSYGLFLGLLFAARPEVRRTAILALGRLGDPRALPYLQSCAADPDNATAAEAQEAIAIIRNLNPEVMVLLRASQAAGSRPDTLLRPANGNNGHSAPDLLLRPTDEAKPNPA